MKKPFFFFFKICDTTQCTAQTKAKQEHYDGPLVSLSLKEVWCWLKMRESVSYGKTKQSVSNHLWKPCYKLKKKTKQYNLVKIKGPNNGESSCSYTVNTMSAVCILKHIHHPFPSLRSTIFHKLWRWEAQPALVLYSSSQHKGKAKNTWHPVSISCIVFLLLLLVLYLLQ